MSLLNNLTYKKRATKKRQVTDNAQLFLDYMREIKEKLNLIFTYNEKQLHVSAIHFELYGQRSNRPYYPLDNGWALTHLDTGNPFFVNTFDRMITPWLIMGGHWEPNIDRVLVDYAKPGMVMLDIGAHCGYYTIKLANKIGSSGKIISFEPNPAINTYCQENIRINGFDAFVTLNKFALGSISSTATLTYERGNHANANLIGQQTGGESFEVDVRKLDDIIDKSLSIDLIKLDAEGYEKAILDGANELLARSPQCAIMIELGLERWEASAKLADIVEACGGGRRKLFLVREDSALERIELSNLRSFLLTRQCHEAYFFVVDPALIASNSAITIK